MQGRAENNIIDSNFYFEGIRDAIQPQLESDYARARYGPLIDELQQMVVDYGYTDGFVAFIRHLHDDNIPNPFHHITTPVQLRDRYRRMTRRQDQRTQDQQMERFIEELHAPERRLDARAARAARHALRVEQTTAEGHAEEAAAAAAAAADAEAVRARRTFKVYRPRSRSPSRGGKKSHKKSGKRNHKKRTHRRRH